MGAASKIAFLVPIIATILLIAYPYFKQRKIRKAVMQLKGIPTKNFLVGHVGVLPRSHHVPNFVIGLVRDYQEQGAHRLLFGPFPTVTVFDPRYSSEIFSSSKHTTKNYMYSFLVPWLGTGLLISSGAKWKARRRLTTPAFHFEVLKRFLELMNEQVDIMIKKMERNQDNEVEFFEYITNCALDIICETAMGKKVYAQSTDGKGPYVQSVYRMSKIVVERTLNPVFISDFIFNLSSLGREHKHHLKILHDFTYSVIKERREFLKDAPTERKPAFLDILLTASVEGEPLTDEDIREEVDTFMFEGHDTTSASLAWTIYLLGSHLEIQQKLREEVNEVMGDSNEVTTEMLNKFKYMEIVMKESLRLFPSVPVIGRTLSEDIVISDVTIPKGTTVNVSIFGMHRNPRYWENPNDFIPERWNNDIEKNHPFLYVPFSAGQRNCIGQNFAKNEEKVVLAKVVKNFSFVSLEKDIHMVPELILRPVNGVRIKIQKI